MSKPIQPTEKPIADHPEWPDYFGEFGCCWGCDETKKQEVRGLQRNVYYNGEFYSCVCLDCKCRKCTWYFDHECQRGWFMENGLPF